MTRYRPPVPLTPEHVRERVASGNTVLDDWLRTRALKNELSGASRTFVTCPTTNRTVVGHYTLAASSVAVDQAPGRVRRNMPDPIPVILLGRLAVDSGHQGVGLGASLLRDAVMRAAGAAASVGARALLVHAIDDTATSWYRHFGFVTSPLDDRTLFLTLGDIRASAERAIT